jgi:hypothetical protein
MKPMSLDELKLPKNNLFKLTCRDGHDNPNYTFTWELSPEGAAILREKGVRFPFMYVFAAEEIPPNKVEGHQEGCDCNQCSGYNEVVEDKLFCLHEGAGQIQFHRQGTFRIYAMVIWYPTNLQSRDTWRGHRRYVKNTIDRYQSVIIDEVGDLHLFSLQHVEEDAVQVTDTFFAPKPNPTLWWWANLWWDYPPKNSCDYKKRLLFLPGLEFQIPIVGIYALLRGLLMGICYLGLLLVGFRPSAFSFRPMFHAFSSLFEQMCDFKSKTCNWALRDAAGEDRKSIPAIISRLPIVWIAAPILLTFLSKSIYHNPKAWMLATLLLVSIVAGGFGLFLLIERINSRRKSVVVYYEQELPKKRRTSMKVRWLDATGKYCLPFQK